MPAVPKRRGRTFYSREPTLCTGGSAKVREPPNRVPPLIVVGIGRAFNTTSEEASSRPLLAGEPESPRGALNPAHRSSNDSHKHPKPPLHDPGFLAPSAPGPGPAADQELRMPASNAVWRRGREGNPPLRSQKALRTEQPARSDNSTSTPRHRGTGSTREESVAHAAQRAEVDRKRKRRERETSAERAGSRRRHVDQSSSTPAPGFSLENTPHEAPGYAGMKDRGMDHRFLAGAAAERLERLRSLGYETIHEPNDAALDGRIQALTDAGGRVAAVITGWPAGWETRVLRVESAFERLERDMDGVPAPKNRRGNFAAWVEGFSYGNSQPHPKQFRKTAREQAALDRFFADEDVQAVFKYLEGIFKTWFPKHYEEYRRCLEMYEGRDGSLKRPYPGGSFAASTINVGPKAICWPHRDASNLVWGICIVWILGQFNHRLGGHLVLHEPMRIVELRPGRGILFPSACITHETIPVGEDESRRGFTAYSAAGLWRFEAQGFQGQQAWKKSKPAEEQAHVDRGDERWRAGLARFMTLAELEDHWARVENSGAPRRSRATTNAPSYAM